MPTQRFGPATIPAGGTVEWGVPSDDKMHYLVAVPTRSAQRIRTNYLRVWYSATILTEQPDLSAVEIPSLSVPSLTFHWHISITNEDPSNPADYYLYVYTFND